MEGRMNNRVLGHKVKRLKDVVKGRSQGKKEGWKGRRPSKKRNQD